MTIIEELKKQIEEARVKILAIQNECSHPLVARETKNRGATGNYDDPEGKYWTEHKCLLCEKQWRTDQDWSRIGDRRGMPTKK
jgi:hypothetical protein